MSQKEGLVEENPMRLAAALAACQTPCPSPSTETTNATYECEDGSELRVAYTFNSVTVIQEGYTTVVLPARISGSAFRYAEGGAALRGRMNEIQWTRPGAEETVCSQTS
jgi:membrane-bound inhibitor of C-type lysozyme